MIAQSVLLPPELKRLGEMLRAKGIRPIEIGNGSRDAEDAIVPSRRQRQSRERRVEHAARIRIEMGPGSQLASVQPGVQPAVA